MQDKKIIASRRSTLKAVAALAGGTLLSPLSFAADKGYRFPQGFLWGAAVAGHQVEGDNVHSDAWLLENVKPSIFVEPSGAGVDHYRLFAEDIAMLASLGLNTFRFSIEWARVEPEEGMFSVAAIEHYRDVLKACHKHKIKAVVSFNHFITPYWFGGRGGWEAEGAAQLFARYCSKVAQELGSMMTLATTFNEPNLARLLFGIPGPLSGLTGIPPEKAMLAEAGKRAGTGKFSSWIFGDFDKIETGLLEGHRLGYQAIKAACPKLPVGLSLAIADDQAVGDPAMRDRKRAIAYLPWFKAVSEHGDFVGVQTYTRALVSPEGELPTPAGARLTSNGMEFWPEALGATIRYTAEHVKLPIYVTENGISTDDDKQREEYIQRALKGVAGCLRDGIDVRGYLHWSLLDNFEWIFGYKPHFGLIAVDRATMRRTIKPSARLLGSIARKNSI
ncbi:aryl-beta-glucosidase [Duganella sp. CF402]|uniref:glycoside hydrolase family 1 protein n=1 Tax=unclassified Duganella TaxID=2636909 RepID=UPI0008B7017D|nr:MULTISPECIES: family 1 glycosylhydrolase [unclassified Duganella]RZT09285.1 beta-glucosidase [Duganella sp. BK701]SEL63266.1 aryl-beta-glucosidase [Duganella sp. CF402]